MVLILTGPMCSGKTTIAKTLEHYGYKRIVTYTTRPKRDGEIDGIDYNFIDEARFLKLVENGAFIEYRDYNATFGHCYYGSIITESQLDSGTRFVTVLNPDGSIITESQLDAGTRFVIVLNPDGARAAKEFAIRTNSRPPFIVYLDVPEYICLSRAKARGDDMAEVISRLKRDEIESFDSFRRDRIADLTIWGTPSIEATIETINKRLLN